MKNTKYNKTRFGRRLLVAPFVFFIILIGHLFFVINRFWHFLKYGGEYINFEENERHTLNEIYAELKKQNEFRKTTLPCQEEN